MTTILIRTIIIYILLITIMRLMGKRQLGELEVSELVSTILLSDIASLPICDQDIPLIYAVIPIITITFFEVVMSFTLTKVPFLKKIISASPSFLINKGVINKKELAKNRISTDELLSEVRQKGVTDISEVEYAIIEQNGKITVIPKAQFSPPKASDLGLSPNEQGLCHILISDGRIDKFGLKRTKKSEGWLRDTLRKQKTELADVFLLTVDDSDKITLIKKGDTIQ